MAARRHVPYLRPRRPRRRLRRVLGWTLLVLCLPPLAWLVWNRIDEAPNADALRWGNPPVREVADAENAWLYLLGIGAAGNDNPVTHGRRRVDAYVARASADPAAEASPEEDERNDPVALVMSVDGISGVAQLCPRHAADCVGWAAAHRPALERLADANRLRLQRLDAASALPQWQEAPLLSANFPAPSVSLVLLDVNLLALDANDDSRIPEVAANIADHAALWRRASEQSQWLLSKFFAFAFMERYQRLLVELYERATPGQRDVMQADIDEVFAAPSAAADNLDVAAYDAFQITAATLRGEMTGIWRSLGNCVSGTPKNGSCGSDLAANASYLPQATRNTIARLSTATADLLAAKPADEAAATQRYAELTEREDPERGRAKLTAMVYNATGKALAVESLSTPLWRKRLNDHETVRRMLLIKLAALRGSVTAANMPDFLAAQPEALRHPYPDKSIVWREGLLALVAPAAVEGSFENDLIVVPYDKSLPPPPPVTSLAPLGMPKAFHG